LARKQDNASLQRIAQDFWKFIHDLSEVIQKSETLHNFHELRLHQVKKIK